MTTMRLQWAATFVAGIALLGLTTTDLSAKTFDIPSGRKSLVAFWKCEGGLVFCFRTVCVQIANKSDGQPGRARFHSDWSPGKYRDHGVHTGKYCDDLWGAIFMGYWLYASPEDEDLSVTAADDIAPSH